MPAGPSSGSERFSPFSSLRHGPYRLLTAGVAPGMLAMQMSTIALGYLAYELSGSATALGLIGLGWGLPMLFLSLAGGVIADRFPRRTILLGSQALIGLAALLGAILLLTGLIQVWHLLLIALIQGTSFAFNMPARQALIADIVGPDDLASAITFNNAVINFTRVVGPPIAGFLIGQPAIGTNGTFILITATYIIVLLILARLPRIAAPTRGHRSGWSDLVEGLRFIWRAPVLVSLLILAFVPMMLGMPYQLLLPVFALGVLEVGPEGLGLLSMASGMGALAGSIGITFLTGSPHQRLIQRVLGILFGVSLAAFAFSGGFLLALVLITIVGAASAGYMSLNNALVMQAAPPALQGRVMSVYMMTFSLMPLASLPIARLADLFGAPATVGTMGCLLAASIIAVGAWQDHVARNSFAPRPRTRGD